MRGPWKNSALVSWTKRLLWTSPRPLPPLAISTFLQQQMGSVSLLIQMTLVLPPRQEKAMPFPSRTIRAISRPFSPKDRLWVLHLVQVSVRGNRQRGSLRNYRAARLFRCRNGSGRMVGWVWDWVMGWRMSVRTMLERMPLFWVYDWCGR